MVIYSVFFVIDCVKTHLGLGFSIFMVIQIRWGFIIKKNYEESKNNKNINGFGGLRSICLEPNLGST